MCSRGARRGRADASGRVRRRPRRAGREQSRSVVAGTSAASSRRTRSRVRFGSCRSCRRRHPASSTAEPCPTGARSWCDELRRRGRHRRHLHRLRRRRRARDGHPRQGVLDAAGLRRRDPRRARRGRPRARRRRPDGALADPALPALDDGRRERCRRRHARARGPDHDPGLRGHALRDARWLRSVVGADRGREAEPCRHRQAAADRAAFADRRHRRTDRLERSSEGGRPRRRDRGRGPGLLSEGVEGIGVNAFGRSPTRRRSAGSPTSSAALRRAPS